MLWRLEDLELAIVARLVVDGAFTDGGCCAWPSGVDMIMEAVFCAAGSDVLELNVEIVSVVSLRGTGGKEFRELVPIVLVEPPLCLVEEASCPVTSEVSWLDFDGAFSFSLSLFPGPTPPLESPLKR